MNNREMNSRVQNSLWGSGKGKVLIKKVKGEMQKEGEGKITVRMSKSHEELESFYLKSPYNTQKSIYKFTFIV